MIEGLGCIMLTGVFLWLLGQLLSTKESRQWGM